MKNVYLVQADIVRGTQDKSIYLPYAIGLIAASAWENKIVRTHYKFKEFIFKCDDVETVVESLDCPAVIGFSNYCWNTEYSKSLAVKVKEKYPDCIVVFGGHNIPNTSTYLEKYSYIDILVHGEGEDPFKSILHSLIDDTMSSVSNISYRDVSGNIIKTKTTTPKSLDYPSPYLEGWFDDIINAYPNFSFNAILETSRGCPYSCAYCDWGLLKSKPRLFPLERVLAEVEWMSEHKIAFIWGADANFGMYDRDLDIIDALAAAKKKTGYPEKMRMNYSKTNFDNVFKIVKKLKECDFDRIGATLSFQSMSADVLDAIGRKNMSFDYYRKMQAKYNEEKMKTYSELILGLPRETYRSFIEGIGKLFELGQHFVFEIYGCNLLPNSLLGQPEQIKKYKIKTVQAEVIRPHNNLSALGVPEYYDLVVETATMSRTEWVRATSFYHFVKSFHGFGFLRVFAIYLFHEHAIPYHIFYDNLLDFFEGNPDLYTSKLYFTIKNHEDEVSRGIINEKLIFEPVKECMWDDHEYIDLYVIYKKDVFYNEIKSFLLGFGIDTIVFNDLFNYQKNIVRAPQEKTKKVDLSYDIHEYITNVYVNKKQPLQLRLNSLHMTDTNVQDDWKDYSQVVVWYGRMGWQSYKDKIDVVYHDNLD